MLASTIAVALQNKRLTIALTLLLALVPIEESRNFKVKITTAGNETYGAWRKNEHDDWLVRCHGGMVERQQAGGNARGQCELHGR